MNCPDHKDIKLKICPGWLPFNGLDPKMRRYSCLDCFEYWYKAPKHCVKRWSVIQAELDIPNRAT